MIDRQNQECKWVRKPDQSLQLQANLWWVGVVTESELKKGLIYWKVNTCPKSLEGYAKNEKEAVQTVEALIGSCKNYEYSIVNKVPELRFKEQLRKEQENG